jgi:predicted nucleic acid-binding Zn finger protein
MVAYIKQGTTEPFYFKKPITISRSGRKFELLKDNPFTIDIPLESFIIKVQGSKGQTYSVNTEEHTCTCPGFTFRGDCKHIKELEVA